MRRATHMLATLLAIFLFLCPSAFADNAEQRELLGLMKKLNSLLESKSAGAAAGVSRAGQIVFLIQLPPRVGNTVFCTATISAVSSCSFRACGWNGAPKI